VREVWSGREENLPKPLFLAYISGVVLHKFTSTINWSYKSLANVEEHVLAVSAFRPEGHIIGPVWL
jgi:hypothetical protein